jgi:hypothetical protein
MGSKSLRYFRYMLKHKPGKLLGCFTVPAIIQNTTVIHPFVHQAQSKTCPNFALQLDYLCVPAVAAQALIIIPSAFCESSLLSVVIPIAGKWPSYFRASRSPEILGTLTAIPYLPAK